MTEITGTELKPGPNWRHVGAFLGLTFGLTYLLDLAIYLRGGLAAPGTVTILQLQMLLPAFSAILLGLFYFPESPIFHSKAVGRGRWFYYYYLALTAIYAFAVLVIWPATSQGAGSPFVVIAQLVAYLGLLVLIGLRLIAGRESMIHVRLTWGNWRYYLLGLGFIAFYVLQALLNGVFGLGPINPAPLGVPSGLNPVTFLIVGGLQTVVLAPILAIVIAFGEEYGWRGYLQSELVKLGKVRGILLVGLIWGAWHWPIILMGWSYPGYPLAGLLLTVLFTTGLAIVLGFAVLKTGSILLAAYLHALNDQVTAFLVALGYKPFDPVFSFGVGIYAVITLAIVALLLLRHPIWREKISQS